MSARPDRLTRLRSCIAEIKDGAVAVMGGDNPSMRLAVITGMLRATNPDEPPPSVDAGLWRSLVINARLFADRDATLAERRELARPVLAGATAVLTAWPAFRAATAIDQSRKDIFG